MLKFLLSWVSQLIFELVDIYRGLNERSVGKEAYAWALYAYGEDCGDY